MDKNDEDFKKLVSGFSDLSKSLSDLMGPLSQAMAKEAASSAEADPEAFAKEHGRGVLEAQKMMRDAASKLGEASTLAGKIFSDGD